MVSWSVRIFCCVLVLFAGAVSSTSCTKRPPALASSHTPEHSTPQPRQELSGWVASYLDTYKKSDPNQRFYGDALLAHADQVVAQRGLGGAVGRRFLIGSITKCMTAVAIMQLQHLGKLNIEDPVRKYIPELPDSHASMTVEQLLSHRAGLGNYTSDEALTKRGHLPHTTQELLQAIIRAPLVSKPGETYYYSNSGYVLLGIVVERVSAQPWSEYLTEHVFTPAGMHETSIDDEGLVQGWVPKGDRWLLAGREHSSFAYASGAVVSTVSDLHRFGRALHAGVLVPKEVFQRMWSFDPDPASPSSYGLGFMRAKLANGQTIVGHDGAMIGFRSSWYMMVDGAWITALLSNTQTTGLDKISNDLFGMAVSQSFIQPPKAQARAPFDPELARQLAGRYKLSARDFQRLQTEMPAELLKGIEFIDWRADGSHSFKPVGQEEFDLFPLQDGHFANDSIGIDIEVLFEDKELVGMILRQGAFSIRYEKQASGGR